MKDYRTRFDLDNPYGRDLNGRARVGGSRNDENCIAARLHAAFLRFHNQVADHLSPGLLT